MFQCDILRRVRPIFRGDFADPVRARVEALVDPVCHLVPDDDDGDEGAGSGAGGGAGGEGDGSGGGDGDGEGDGDTPPSAGDGAGDGETIPKAEHERALARIRSRYARKVKRLERDFADVRRQLDGDGDDDDDDDDSGSGDGGKDRDAESKYRARLEKERRKREEAERKLRLSRAETQIRAAARKHEGDPDTLVDILRGKLRFESEDSDASALVSLLVDGEADELTIDEAVEELIRQRPFLSLKEAKRRGTGSRSARGGQGGGQGGGTPDKLKTFEEAEVAFAKRLKSL